MADNSHRTDDLSSDSVAAIADKLDALSTGARRGRPTHRRSPSVRHQRPWSGPPRQSAFVFLFRGDKLFAVRNRKNQLGVPGGKRDDDDKTIFAAARREFGEETGGASLPPGPFNHFEWGTSHHALRVYYRDLSEKEAAALPVGALKCPDVDLAEVETLWSPWDASVRGEFRPHLAQALAIYEAIAAAAEAFPDGRP